MRTSLMIGAMLGIALSGCAGRDPQQIATVLPQDQTSTCSEIQAEIQANTVKLKDLGAEQGGKVAQNVAAGLVGIVIWPVWFAMDFKGAATKDVAALEARQQYLTAIAVDRCSPPPLPAQKRRKPAA